MVVVPVPMPVMAMAVPVRMCSMIGTGMTMRPMATVVVACVIVGLVCHKQPPRAGAVPGPDLKPLAQARLRNQCRRGGGRQASAARILSASAARSA